MNRQMLELGLLNLLSYFVLTWDIRTVAQGNIPYAILVSMVIGVLTVTIFKRLQDAPHNLRTCLVYAGFGTVGTVAGIIISEYVLGK